MDPDPADVDGVGAGPGGVDGAGALMLPGMPEPLVAATPTRIGGWESCPRRYRFTYLERPSPRRGAPWAHVAVGGAVHAALARWWRGPVAARTPGRAAALVAASWVGEGFRDATQEVAVKARAAETVSRYTASLDPAAEPVGVERTVGLRTAVLSLSGRVDRLDERGPDRELVVVDYKTGRRPPAPADAASSLALAVYAAAAARTLHRVCRRVELHHLPTGRVVAHEHTAASVDRALARADRVGRELREVTARWTGGLTARRVDEVFPPRPGPGCAWCDFRTSCPAGAAVSPRLPSWAGLDDDGTPADGADD